MGYNNVLKASKTNELLSYIINQDPVLSAEIDLPVQGQDIRPIGELILNNERYRNAFLNTVNLIGLTVIKRNAWDNPWKFTTRGTLNYGQQIREIILDLCNANDYNENFDNKTKFLETQVPNIFNYIHEVNFQKYYHTTVSDAQMAMAFSGEDSLLDFIVQATEMLNESLIYDTYIVDKYMLCRRILDGTVTTIKIENFDTKTTRQIVADMKSVSNKMTFRKPNFNPAGLRKATSFDEQITIVNTDYDAQISTEVLATSYFKNDAEMKTQLSLIDGFDEHDTQRLEHLLKSAYKAFTDEELQQLKNIPACIISKEWFMDYDYAFNTERQKEFENPTTLEKHLYLHAWRVFSTSPFENAVVFTKDTPAVNSITLSPSEASISAGQSLQLISSVNTTGFANKSLLFEVTKGAEHGVTVDLTGKIFIPSNFPVSSDEAPQVEITATSIYDKTVTATADITVL